jgi:hypothetical protein
MAYSGTVSQTNFNTRRVIENAARRCKLPAQSLTPEHVDIANDQLYLLLSDLSNRGIQLWCIEKTLYPLYEGQSDITTITGTVDILNSNLRTLQQATGVDTTTAQTHETMFSTPTVISTVGIQWSAASGGVLSLQRSDDGVAWTTVQTETPVASAGEWTWYDLDTSVASLYFRIVTSAPALSYSRVYLGNTPTEIPLARLSRDDYTNLPNKTFSSNRPLQFWLDRQVQRPVMNLWPVPNAAAEVMQVVVWAQRHIMDVGTMTQEVEVPQRWYEAIVAMLAARLAMEYIEVDAGLIGMLDQKAKESLYFAQQEERDNSPMMILPNISMYTR